MNLRSVLVLLLGVAASFFYSQNGGGGGDTCCSKSGLSTSPPRSLAPALTAALLLCLASGDPSDVVCARPELATLNGAGDSAACFYSATYAEARRRFRAAAEAHGLELSALPIGDGESRALWCRSLERHGRLTAAARA